MQGRPHLEQIKFINEIMVDLKQLGQTNYLNKAYSLKKGGGQPQEASKTQGTLLGAHKASPTEEAAIEPAIMFVCVCFWPPVPRWGSVKHEIPISSLPLDDIPSIP
jgi:hypothetical protein